MTAPRYTLEPLRREHDRSGFSSGSAELDRYFRQQAGQEHRRRVATVYVAVDTFRAGEIAGYYTLSATTVEATDLPDTIASKLPRYPRLPAILLGRLARDERWRGEGIGARLLADASDRSLLISGQLGALFIVVDAKDAPARIFYERYGFLVFPQQENRLFLPLAQVRSL